MVGIRVVCLNNREIIGKLIGGAFFSYGIVEVIVKNSIFTYNNFMNCASGALNLAGGVNCHSQIGSVGANLYILEIILMGIGLALLFMKYEEKKTGKKH